MTFVAVCLGQPLGRELANLRRVEADPDQARVGIGLPVVEELLQVAVPPDLLPCHRAVNGDLMPFDVLEDAIVGRGRAAHVVFRLEAIDRHDELQPVQPLPLAWNGSNGARHELRVYASFGHLRQDRVEFLVSDQRLASHDRDVQRPEAIDERHESRDQLVAFVIGQPSERDVATEMLIAVGVATRTSQRALLRDLDRDVRAVSSKNAAPSLDHLVGSNTGGAHDVATIMVYSSCTWSVIGSCRASRGESPGSTGGASLPSSPSTRTPASSPTTASSSITKRASSAKRSTSNGARSGASPSIAAGFVTRPSAATSPGSSTTPASRIATARSSGRRSGSVQAGTSSRARSSPTTTTRTASK